jgi:hypothetical protein
MSMDKVASLIKSKKEHGGKKSRKYIKLELTFRPMKEKKKKGGKKVASGSCSSSIG